MGDGGGVVGGGAGVVAGVEGGEAGDGEDVRVLVQLQHLCTRDLLRRHAVLGPCHQQRRVAPVHRALDAHTFPEGQVLPKAEWLHLGRDCGEATLTLWHTSRPRVCFWLYLTPSHCHLLSCHAGLLALPDTLSLRLTLQHLLKLQGYTSALPPLPNTLSLALTGSTRGS